MENHIKECQLDMFADRTSAATMRTNQLRLWFASMGLRAALRPARHRPRSNPLRRRHLRNHPLEAAQDRRPSDDQRLTPQGRHDLRLPLVPRVGARL